MTRRPSSTAEETKERSKVIDMLKIQSQNKTMTQDLEEFRRKAVHNQGHLIEALRQNEYLLDMCERTWHGRSLTRSALGR